MENKLAVLKGPQNESNVIISSSPYLIGRCRTANFIIAHVNVSRNHCQIVKENGLWKINDFSSSGTYVNGRLVGKEQSTMLKSGDSIRFGPAESNLCWTFCSFSSSENVLDIKNAEPQAVLDVRSDNSCLKDNHASDKVIYLYGKCESKLNAEQTILKTTELQLSRRTNETRSIKNELKKEIECNGVSEKLPNFEEDTFVAKEENDKESEGKKIQELTKELQQIQSALNDLEKKNNALQGKLAGKVMINSETSMPSNLVENLTDLMESELQCTICSELFVTAVTLNCTHTFCKYCIDLWKKKQKTCPICRKKITNETRSLVVDNYINKMVENLSSELKLRRECIVKERNDFEPVKKRSKVKR